MPRSLVAKEFVAA